MLSSITFPNKSLNASKVANRILTDNNINEIKLVVNNTVDYLNDLSGIISGLSDLSANNIYVSTFIISAKFYNEGTVQLFILQQSKDLYNFDKHFLNIDNELINKVYLSGNSLYKNSNLLIYNSVIKSVNNISSDINCNISISANNINISSFIIDAKIISDQSILLIISANLQLISNEKINIDLISTNIIKDIYISRNSLIEIKSNLLPTIIYDSVVSSINNISSDINCNITIKAKDIPISSLKSTQDLIEYLYNKLISLKNLYIKKTLYNQLQDSILVVYNGIVSAFNLSNLKKIFGYDTNLFKWLKYTLSLDDSQYLIFIANEDNVKITLKQVGIPNNINLNYQKNDKIWREYTIDKTLTLSANDKIKFYRSDSR